MHGALGVERGDSKTCKEGQAIITRYGVLWPSNRSSQNGPHAKVLECSLDEDEDDVTSGNYTSHHGVLSVIDGPQIGSLETSSPPCAALAFH